MNIIETENLAAFGRRLAGYRISKNLKQADLALHVGISIGTLARIEAGEDTRFSNILKILNFFDLDKRLIDVVPDQSNSPMEQVRNKRNKRKRCRRKTEPQTPWHWGDE